MQPIPYVFFRGNCAQAMRAYAEIFGGKADIVSFADMPPGAGAGMGEVPKDAVMHAALRIGDGWLYGSDDPTPGAVPMAGTNVHLSFPTVDEAQRVFAALAEGGEVRMKLEPTFWAPAFGTLSDRFGTRWMISADPPAQ